MGQFSFSLSDIKKAMGPSLGLVSNRYLVEIPINIKNQKSLAILARSTSLPESNVGVVDYYYKGRRFKARGEHVFAGTYTLNFTDDSEMKVRELFDTSVVSLREISRFTKLVDFFLQYFPIKRNCDEIEDSSKDNMEQFDKIIFQYL